MKGHEVTTKHIKEVFFKNQTSMTSTRKMFAEIRNKYKEGGATYYHSRSLPRDWVLDYIKKKFLYSEKEIEQIRTTMDEVDRGLFK